MGFLEGRYQAFFWESVRTILIALPSRKPFCSATHISLVLPEPASPMMRWQPGEKDSKGPIN